MMLLVKHLMGLCFLRNISPSWRLSGSFLLLVSGKAMAHDEGDGTEDEDGKDWVDLLQIGDERRHHGAQPGHGAGEGEGRGPDHGGEELVGVGVDDPPADLRETAST